MPLMTIEGQITGINPANRTMTVKDRDGITHPIRYTQGHDQEIGKLKQWWFTKATGEVTDGVLHLESLGFFRRPDDWPSNNKSGKFAPRNDRLNAKQTCMKEAAEVVRTYCQNSLEHPPEDQFVLIVAGYRLLRDAMFEDENGGG